MVKSNSSKEEIIEKIDIGGISLIRAAAKNFNDVLCVSTKDSYKKLSSLLSEKNGFTNLKERKEFAVEAFNTSSHYDTAIYNHFNSENIDTILQVRNNYKKTNWQNGLTSYSIHTVSDFLNKII